jgi:hypothetical protein
VAYTWKAIQKKSKVKLAVIKLHYSRTMRPDNVCNGLNSSRLQIQAPTSTAAIQSLKKHLPALVFVKPNREKMLGSFVYQYAKSAQVHESTCSSCCMHHNLVTNGTGLSSTHLWLCNTQAFK